MNLYNDIQDLTNRLNQAIKLLAKYGREFAETERDYKIQLRQEALKLRAEKNMPVTLIQQVVYGVPEVAEKRFKRDVAEAMYQYHILKYHQENVLYYHFVIYSYDQLQYKLMFLKMEHNMALL